MNDEPKIARTPAGGFYLQGGQRSYFDGKPIPVMRLRVPPRFIPSHVAHGSNSRGEREWTEPDRVAGRDCWFGIKRGRIDSIRFLDQPEVVAAVQALDDEEAMLRERLTKIHHERQDMFATIWPACPSLKVGDIKDAASRGS